MIQVVQVDQQAVNKGARSIIANICGFTYISYFIVRSFNNCCFIFKCQKQVKMNNFIFNTTIFMKQQSFQIQCKKFALIMKKLQMDQIYEGDDSEFSQDSSLAPQKKLPPLLQAEISEDEEGSVLEDNQRQQGQIIQGRIDQIFDSSSSQFQNQQDKKEFYKYHEASNLEMKEVGQEQMLRYALQAAIKTNKKMLVTRKKNQRRITEIQKIRMSQQSYLGPGNTHFRGSASEYSIITSDRRGREYFHPNPSLKIHEMTLNQFIRKNITEQSSASYLNQVVKFENFAYQQRKKRKHQLQ